MENKTLEKWTEHFEITKREAEVIDIVWQWGGIDGAHHKDWCLDQIARVLCGDKYKDFVTFAKTGAVGNFDGPEEYDYDEGIAP
jgi:hypothetical protein